MSREVLVLLGQTIRMARIEGRMTIAMLAERAGLSRGLVGRIEKGDPSCAIGGVAEVATILGLPLFQTRAVTLDAQIAVNRRTLSLLPKAVRPSSRPAIDDDF